MRYLALLLPLVAIGCADGYDGYAGGGYAGGGYAGGGYAGGPYAGPAYAYNGNGYAQPPYGGENCGTPDEPKACPPLPRHPLAYYPGDRW